MPLGVLQGGKPLRKKQVNNAINNCIMNKTISVKLEYDGKKYNKKAVLVEALSGYYVSEKGADDCTGICEYDCLDRGIWSVSVELNEELTLEIFFKYDAETYEYTFENLYSYVLNEDGIILDEVTPDVKATNRYRY